MDRKFSWRSGGGAAWPGADTARGGAAMVTAGLLLAAYARGVKSAPVWALRPPGAIAEDDFTGACVRCGQCVQACPYDTLSLATLGGDVPTGTPFFEPRRVACEMCENIPCVEACPTGALDGKLTDIDDARMGLAVLIDRETCLSLLGLRCEVCYRACPLMGEAITLEREHNERTGKHAIFIPTVHSDACTGCGKCVHVCVLEKPAIKILPIWLAKGELGGHYRKSWPKKSALHGLTAEVA